MMATECLDLEDLAAFADGRLFGAERRQVVEHLADCESCYEIFAEVKAFEDEEAPGGAAAESASPEPMAEVVVHPRARAWLRPGLGGLAAAAVLALVVMPLVRVDRFPAPDPGWDGHRWMATRGGPVESPRVWPPQDLDREKAAFRLGVRTIDLRVALSADRIDRAAEVCEELEGLLRNFERPETLTSRYEGLRRRLGQGEPAEILLEEANEAEGLLEDYAVPRHYYVLGRWTEEARAAAVTRNRRFFTRRETGRLLDGFEGIEMSPPGISEELEKVIALIAGGVAEEDLEALLRSLDRIDTYAGAP